MITLRCACCGLPYATLQNGLLMVESKHHGMKHTNAIPLSQLMELLEGDEGNGKKEQPARPVVGSNGK